LARDQVLATLRAGLVQRADLIASTGLHPRSLERLLADLRSEGHRILLIKDGSHWFYRLDDAGEDSP